MLSEIRDAEDRDHATKAIHAGARHDATKYPKDVAKIVDHTETLLAFFDFPGRALDPPEDDQPDRATFATVGLRTKVTKGPRLPSRRPGHGLQADRVGPGPVAGGRRMHLVALVRAGAKFDKGVMIERPNRQDQEAAA